MIGSISMMFEGVSMGHEAISIDREAF